MSVGLRESIKNTGRNNLLVYNRDSLFNFVYRESITLVCEMVDGGTISPLPSRCGAKTTTKVNYATQIIIITRVWLVEVNLALQSYALYIK